MKRLWFLVAALFLLAACGGSAEETTSDSAEAAATQPVATEAPQEDVEEEDSAETAMPPADVDLTAAIQPEADPAAAGVIRDRDWTQGTDDPLVTIIEYGDFQ